LAESFKKNPALRTPSVGALADAVGGAYGLGGTHHNWARIPEAELSAAIETTLPALLQAASKADDLASSHALDELIDEITSAAEPAAKPGLQTGASASLAAGEVIAPPAAHRLSWGVVLAVGGGALLLGVLIVLFLSR
jgi:hypothetical protein